MQIERDVRGGGMAMLRVVSMGLVEWIGCTRHATAATATRHTISMGKIFQVLAAGAADMSASLPVTDLHYTSPWIHFSKM